MQVKNRSSYKCIKNTVKVKNYKKRQTIQGDKGYYIVIKGLI